MGQALRIARSHRQGWKHQIEQLPETCPHTDCGLPHSCRQRIAEYLRMQWRMAERRDAR
jgi:hypothetical protein